jgi:hypothetical protein
MVRSVVLQTTGSGRYLNESLGIKAGAVSVAGLENVSTTSSVFPNPFDEKLTLSIFNGDTFQITNSLGQTILDGKSEHITINTSNWDAGLYLLRTGNQIHKLIKQ